MSRIDVPPEPPSRRSPGSPPHPPPGRRGRPADAPSATRLHPAVASFLPGVDPGLPLATEPGPGEPAVGFAQTVLTGGDGTGIEIVLVAWHFGVAGGSFGQRDASTWSAACALAVELRRPLVAVTSSGGTRLTEGAVGLLGMARATLARERLAAAGIPLVAVVAQPTTGGVWVTVGSRADLRCAVAGAVVGFAGPRVVRAVTGTNPGPDSHRAESAFAAGLVDAVLPAAGVGSWLVRALAALRPGPAPVLPRGPVPAERADAARGGAVDSWQQVLLTRNVDRPAAGEVLAELLGPASAELAAPRGDRTVTARVGQLGGQPVVGVALAADREGSPTADGFRLLRRAAGMAARLRLPLVTVVDTPGADPGPAQEADGLAAAIADCFAAVLAVPTPTLGLLIGEGGSGGALAALVCDRLLATPDSYLAALVPEGAGAALRRPPAEAARLQHLTPPELLFAGVLDGVVPAEVTSAGLQALLAAELAGLAAQQPDERLSRRSARWSGPIGDRLGEIPS